MTEDVIDVEEEGTELEVRHTGEVTLFQTDDPQEIVEKATGIATVLAKVLKTQKLTAQISGREHVLVEGWTFCGTMLGVFPVCTWTRPVEDGWEARVEARTLTGAVVGAAEAECLRSEKTWKNRDDYALRSMAQTRATSKALRLPLGFIVSLAGFEATPAEEMPSERTMAEESLASANPAENHPSLVEVHFGKNKGTPLGALTPKQVQWYAQEWQASSTSQVDVRLKLAAIAMHSGTADDPGWDIPFS